MDGKAQVGNYGNAVASGLTGGTEGGDPYQSAAGTTSFAYPNTSTAFVWLDGTRTDSYTPDGTYLLPYKTLAQMFAGLASVTSPIVIYSAPMTSSYTYTGNISLPTQFMTIYGNESTWAVTGNLTVNAGFEIYNLHTTATGSLTYAATSALESERIGGSLTIAGGVFTSGYEHFFAMAILSNTVITLNPTATPVFTNVVGTPLFKTAAGSTAATVLTIIDCQSLATGAYTNVDMSNGGLVVIRGFAATNNNSVANINLSGSSGASSSVANLLTGVSAGQVVCGSAYTYVAPDSLFALLSGTALHFVGAAELATASLTAQSASIGATTIYITTAAGLYRVTASVQTTTAGSAGTVLTSVNGTSSATASLTSLNATQSLSTMFYAGAGTAIQYTTTVANNTGGVYRVDAAVERMG